MPTAYSSGLTSLRDTPLRSSQPTFDTISPKEKEQIQLQEIRSEISLLIKQKDNLLYQVKNLNLSVEKTKERNKSNTEVKRLKIEKLKLLGEIRKFTDLLLSLKDNRTGILKGFNEFGKERTQALEKIAKEISKDIESEDTRIFLEYQQMEENIAFLTGMASYYDQYFQIVEQQTLDNQKANSTNRQARILIEKDSERVKRELREAEDKSREARRLHEAAKKENDSIQTMSVSLKKKMEKTSQELNDRERELKVREQELKAEQNGLVIEKERLRSLKRKLEDKEATLGRVYREIQILKKK